MQLRAITTFGLAALLSSTTLSSCGHADTVGGKSNVAAGQDANGPTANSADANATLATIDQITEAEGGPYYVGRFDTSDAAGPKFSWPGSSIYARFTGTGISMVMNELNPPSAWAQTDGTSVTQGNMYDVIIDGGTPTIVSTQYGKNTYTLASGLSQGAHSVVIVKRTETFVGTAQFEGFVVNGEPLAAPKTLANDRRIEMLGDSITAGYGVDGANANCTYSPATEDNTATYGYLAAKQLKAEIHVNAWSGKGLWRNDDNSTTETLPMLYQRTLAADDNSTWDFNSWIPQVVVVNVGSNDFVSDDPPEAQFESTYVQLLQNIRGHYPKALILCAMGPMLTDAWPAGENQQTTSRAYIQAAVQQTADANIQYIEFPVQTGAVGCDSHPNISTQASMGAQLAAAIAAKTGW